MTNDPRVLAELQTAENILDGIGRDLAELLDRWPKSRRGSNCQRLLDSIAFKRDAALACVRDARDLMEAGNDD